MIIEIVCIVFLLAFGFVGGVSWSAYVVCSRAEKIRKAFSAGIAEDHADSHQFQAGIAVAAKCWCDPRTINTEMDTDLGIVFAEKIGEYVDALKWCSGASDFQRGGDGVPDGCAVVGFDKIVRPLLRS
jgi:hypothetical protein